MASRRKLHHTLLGKSITIEFGHCGNGRWGTADKSTNRIKISRSATGKLLVDTVVHEILHLADPHKTEDWIEETATLIADVLDRLNLITEGHHAGTKRGNAASD